MLRVHSPRVTPTVVCAVLYIGVLALGPYSGSIGTARKRCARGGRLTRCRHTGEVQALRIAQFLRIMPGSGFTSQSGAAATKGRKKGGGTQGGLTKKQKDKKAARGARSGGGGGGEGGEGGEGGGGC